MMTFQYKAVDRQGKVVTGALEAPSEDNLVASLHSQGLIPIRVALSGDDVRRKWRPALFRGLGLDGRPKGRDVMRFTQDLATLLQAGLPLDRSLRIVRDASDKTALRKIIRGLLQDISEGTYLSDAMEKHTPVFSLFYINMVRTGEAGGTLEAVLERLGQFLESTQELKDDVAAAMAYPLFVTTIGGVSIIILLTFVIPRFAMIFADMGQAVPLPTRFLLGLAEFLRAFFIPLLGLLLIALVAWRRFSHTSKGRLRIDGWRLKWPVVGRLTRTLETARLARTLGTLISGGVSILEALALARSIMGNRVMANALDGIRERVKGGDRLAGSLSESALFPRLAVQMILVGEETGRLDRMLLKIGAIYDQNIRQDVKKMIRLLEPALILAMGLVVGFIVIAMLMAIFSMNELPL